MRSLLVYSTKFDRSLSSLNCPEAYELNDRIGFTDFVACRFNSKELQFMHLTCSKYLDNLKIPTNTTSNCGLVFVQFASREPLPGSAVKMRLIH